METEVLGNIPRLYTALADWLACLLYLFFLPKRTVGWRRYTIHAGFAAARRLYAGNGASAAILVSALHCGIHLDHVSVHPNAGRRARPVRGVLLRPRVYFGGTGRLAGMAALLLYGRAAGYAGRGCACVHLAVVYAAVYGVVFALERNYNDIASPLHVHKRNSSARCSSVWRSMPPAT